MSEYKVPQDVEAEDKLIGWLSFRQLVYAGIAVAAGFMCFITFQIFPPLVLLPLPVALLFGTLTLPLRKDQPLETYLIGVVRFYLKSKIRRWDPDGVASYVEIVTPAQEQRILSKAYGPEGAQERLDYLARIMDSRGWAYKQVDGSPYSQNFSADVAAEASTAVDVLDEHASVSQSFSNLIKQSDTERRQTAIERMQQAQSEPAGQSAPGFAAATATDISTLHPTFNPYPTSMHQKVILPAGQKAKIAPKPIAKPVTATIPPQVSPGIISLANNDSLSVSTIAHEAKRLEEKEVVINLH